MSQNPGPSNAGSAPPLRRDRRDRRPATGVEEKVSGRVRRTVNALVGVAALTLSLLGASTLGAPQAAAAEPCLKKHGENVRTLDVPGARGPVRKTPRGTCQAGAYTYDRFNIEYTSASGRAVSQAVLVHQRLTNPQPLVDSTGVVSKTCSLSSRCNFSFSTSTPTRTAQPVGNLAVVSLGRAGVGLRVAGWARDPDYNGPLTLHVKVYYEGEDEGEPVVHSIDTNIVRHDILGGPFGFDRLLPLPAPLPDGAAVQVYALNVKRSGAPDDLGGINPPLPYGGDDELVWDAEDRDWD